MKPCTCNRRMLFMKSLYHCRDRDKTGQDLIPANRDHVITTLMAIVKRKFWKYAFLWILSGSRLSTQRSHLSTIAYSNLNSKLAEFHENLAKISKIHTFWKFHEIKLKEIHLLNILNIHRGIKSVVHEVSQFLMS